MTDSPRRLPLQTGGRLWGHRRVRLGVSLRQLASEAGIGRGLLSLMESGRMTPTSEEYDRIIAALDRFEAATGIGPEGNAA
jgi:transcriptional regulator with XRE-family HTH domain